VVILFSFLFSHSEPFIEAEEKKRKTPFKKKSIDTKNILLISDKQQK